MLLCLYQPPDATGLVGGSYQGSAGAENPVGYLRRTAQRGGATAQEAYGRRGSASEVSGRGSAIPKPPEAVQALDMRAGIVVNVTPADRRRLEAIVADRGAPQAECRGPF
jgi:hypothetical protein